MTDQLLRALLDSMPEVVLLVDREHVIRYMNRAATSHFKQGMALVGTSIFACHSPRSNGKIHELVAELDAGAEELLVSQKPGRRVTVRAVRDDSGALVGYYERYEITPVETP